MSGDVGVTSWRVDLESIVAPGVDGLEGHGEVDETAAMWAYEGFSQRGMLIQSQKIGENMFHSVTSHLKADISQKGKSPSSAQHI